jgi:hypothetical protein
MIFYSGNPRASYRLIPLKERLSQLLIEEHDGLPDPGRDNDKDWKGKEVEGGERDWARRRTRTGTIGTGDGASSGSEGEGKENAFLTPRGPKTPGATLQVPSIAGEGEGGGREDEGEKKRGRERANSVMMIDLRAGSFVPLVLKVEEGNNSPHHGSRHKKRHRRKNRRTRKPKRSTSDNHTEGGGGTADKGNRDLARAVSEKAEKAEKAEKVEKIEKGEKEEKAEEEKSPPGRNRSKSLPSSKSMHPKPKPGLSRSCLNDEDNTTPKPAENPLEPPSPAPSRNVRVTTRELEALQLKLAMLDEPKEARDKRPKLKSSRKHVKKSGNVQSPKKPKRRTVDETGTHHESTVESVTSAAKRSKSRPGTKDSGDHKSSTTSPPTPLTKSEATTMTAIPKELKNSANDYIAGRTRARSRSLPSIPREDILQAISPPPLATTRGTVSSPQVTWSAVPRQSISYAPRTSTLVTTRGTSVGGGEVSPLPSDPKRTTLTSSGRHNRVWTTGHDHTKQ